MADPVKDAALVPPYVSFATFNNFLKSLGQHVPGRIDKSVMSTMAGGAQAQVLQALKYLKLISNEGVPTDKLAPLVTSEGADYQKALRSVLTDAYPFLSQGFKLETATPKMLDDEFAKLATGDTVRKCVTFFIPAATAAGMSMGHHIKQPKKRTMPTNGKAKKPKATSTSSTATAPAPAHVGTANIVEGSALAPMSWHQLLLSKFPSFDPSWPDEVKTKWFESFADLMKKGGGP